MIKKFIYNRIYILNPIYRKIILILLDLFLIFSAIYFSFWITKISDSFFDLGEYSWIELYFLLISAPLYFLLGQYRSLTRYFGSEFIYTLLNKNFFLLALLSLLSYLLNLKSLSFQLSTLIFLVITFNIFLSRIIIKDLVQFLKKNKSKNLDVVIYGAGQAGAQLALALKMEGVSNILFFVDDDINLNGRLLNGIPIYNPSQIEISKKRIKKVLLAMPSITKEKCRNIFEKISILGLPVLRVPPIEEITLGNSKIDDLRPLDINDLLGRDNVKPNKKFLKLGIEDFSICITGAGGSIGSELCMQISRLNPSQIFLIESSEYNLYKISKKLFENKDFLDVKINSILGNVCDLKFLENFFSENKVDLIFHAAAYKHVPLVELNPLEGIRNNVISTYFICKMALKHEVKKLTFISTDKAVRPTNVMGASKRLAENIVQAFDRKSRTKYKSSNKRVKFSMVRFGNVLGSSGSVIPLFKQQINNGGPVTITDPSITRYFMTISEAVELVLQASYLAKGGDLFLLDMGDPVKIIDLAHQMIFLSGFTVKNDLNPNGDIEVKFIGLRPGEKLYEELLIDSCSEPTEHPLIYRANEKFIPLDLLEPDLKIMINQINKMDEKNVFKILQKLVPEWKKKPFLS